MPERARGLDPTARKCVWWAVGCFVAGAVALVAIPQIFGAVQTSLRPGEQALLIVSEPLMVIAQWGFFATGGALIGAAVVVQWLHRNLISRLRPAPRHDDVA